MLVNSLLARVPRRGTILLSLVMMMMLVVNTAVLAAEGDSQNEEDAGKSGAGSDTGSDTDLDGGGAFTLHMPFMYHPVAPVQLTSTLANAANTWTLSWTDIPAGATGYVLQESQVPDFSVISNEFTLGAVASYERTLTPSPNNVYFYRIRVLVGDDSSIWSNVVRVVGAYFDNFNDDTTGWAMRRTSYLEETVGYYGSGSEAGNYIIIVADRWDWLIASPLQPAPPVPYVVEYRARVHDPSNLISGGFTFAGDWNGGACPDLNNVYQQTNCFNSFHNLNFIWYGPIKLLYERINQLVWCPTCGGALLKRIGDTVDAGQMINDGPSFDYHTYKIEVRADGAHVFIDGTQRYHYTNPIYFEQPYFGVFASTDEYKPSIWFFDYVRVTPLD